MGMAALIKEIAEALMPEAHRVLESLETSIQGTEMSTRMREARDTIDSLGTGESFSCVETCRQLAESAGDLEVRRLSGRRQFGVIYEHDIVVIRGLPEKCEHIRRSLSEFVDCMKKIAKSVNLLSRSNAEQLKFMATLLLPCAQYMEVLAKKALEIASRMRVSVGRAPDRQFVPPLLHSFDFEDAEESTQLYCNDSCLIYLRGQSTSLHAELATKIKPPTEFQTLGKIASIQLHAKVLLHEIDRILWDLQSFGGRSPRIKDQRDEARLLINTKAMSILAKASGSRVPCRQMFQMVAWETELILERTRNGQRPYGYIYQSTRNGLQAICEWTEEINIRMLLFLKRADVVVTQGKHVHANHRTTVLSRMNTVQMRSQLIVHLAQQARHVGNSIMELSKEPVSGEPDPPQCVNFIDITDVDAVRVHNGEIQEAGQQPPPSSFPEMPSSISATSNAVAPLQNAWQPFPMNAAPEPLSSSPGSSAVAGPSGPSQAAGSLSSTNPEPDPWGDDPEPFGDGTLPDYFWEFDI